MPRYFFHICEVRGTIPDEEGMEFSTQNLAEAEGFASARDLAAAAQFNTHNLGAYAVEVADEAGTVVRRIKVEAPYRLSS